MNKFQRLAALGFVLALALIVTIPAAAEDGTANGLVKSELRAYFDLGGLQVQLSFADVATLRDAQEHPERHRDLMVRITGYSAAFVDMTRTAQDEIIRREEMGG